MAAPNRGRGDDIAANRVKRDRVIELDASPERVAKPDGYLHDDKRVLSDIISELVYVNYASDVAAAAGAVTSFLTYLKRYVSRFGPARRRRAAAHGVLPCAGSRSAPPTIWTRTLIRRRGSSRCSQPTLRTQSSTPSAKQASGRPLKRSAGLLRDTSWSAIWGVASFTTS